MMTTSSFVRSVQLTENLIVMKMYNVLREFNTSLNSNKCGLVYYQEGCNNLHCVASGVLTLALCT